MCGIIGYVGNEEPKGILLDGLKRLEYRGYDSAGIAIQYSDQVSLYRSEGRLSNLEKKLSDVTFEGQIGIGHTRWATHGIPSENNAHPHHVGAITLVHNGIIENYLEHRNELVSQGRKISSETDSEIISHLMDIEIQKGAPLRQAIKRVLPRLEGAYAIVMMSLNQPDTLVGLRNGPPLLLGIGDKGYFIASDVQAILHRTNRVVYLEDRQMVVCSKDSFEILDEHGNIVDAVVKEINWTPDQMDKAGYKHYMLKEIHEQPQAIANTIDGNINHSAGLIEFPDLKNYEQILKKINRIYMVGCGTAYYAGLVGKEYLERWARISVQTDIASEFRYRDPILDENTLCIFISQSGETADTLAALKQAKKRGICTLCICNVRESTLARESDIVLYTNAGPEIGVASTKAFTTQLSILYMFAVQLGYLRQNLTKGETQDLTKELIRVPMQMEQVLSLENQIKESADKLAEFGDFFYLGRGIQYPIALEGALKLKEISYLHAEGYPAGELKHGPIALIDRKVVTFALAPKVKEQKEDPAYLKLRANIQEVKARGGKMISIGTEGDELLQSESWINVGIVESSWGVNPLLLSIPIQLFAYYVALQRGTDVDKPRNLAKSVTVE